VDLPKKHGRGGQSSNRFANIRNEKRLIYTKRVAEEMKKVFIGNNNMPNV
jgi:peptide chain release factor subunit 1